jgi:hypothetical protein
MRSIFLDLNHWIALARAVYGKTVRPDHKTACERLREAVRSKKIFLPLQISHLVEYSRANSISRRQRMAAVFEEFTQNYFFAAWSTVLPHEFSLAISITFGLPNISADPVIFGKGSLFSLSEKAKELIRQDPDIHLGLGFHESLSKLPGMLYDLLTFPNEPGRLTQLTSDRQRQSNYSSGREAARRNFNSIDEAVRAQAAIYTFHHQRELHLCLHLYGKSFADFINLGPVGMSKFFDHVPSLNVDRSLTIARDRHWDRAVQGNDLQDIGYLALAVPYCDAVLVENFWGHLVRTHKMDSKYGTVVLTDLADVIEFLDRC